MYGLENPEHKISLCKKYGNIPSIKFTLKVVDLKPQFNVELKELDYINFSTLKLVLLKMAIDSCWKVAFTTFLDAL